MESSMNAGSGVADYLELGLESVALVLPHIDREFRMRQPTAGGHFFVAGHLFRHCTAP